MFYTLILQVFTKNGKKKNQISEKKKMTISEEKKIEVNKTVLP